MLVSVAPAPGLKRPICASQTTRKHASVEPIVIIITAVLGVLLFVQVNAHWHSGILFILGAGFVQDVVRKLVPGEPVALSAVVAVVMLIVWGIGLGEFRGQSSAMNLRLK